MEYSGTLSPEISGRERLGMEYVRRAAREGIVLLRNEDHVLPLKEGERVALFGGGAVCTVKGGTGSGDVNERKSVSIWEGLKNAGVSLSSEDWLAAYQREDKEQRLLWRDRILAATQGLAPSDFFRVYTGNPYQRPSGRPLGEEDADPSVSTALFVISRVAGENADRTRTEGDFYLSAWERQSLLFLSRHYENLVLLVNTGGPIGLSFLEEIPNIKAILVLSQLGMEGGNALADILLGKESPSGKLSATWARDYGDYCVSRAFHSQVEERYEEGIFVGYRYLDALGREPVFAFGEGLSYASFSLTEPVLSLSEGRGFLTLRVRNTSEVYSGKEVAQLYMAPPAGSLPKERKRLLAFGKTRCLAPGEEQELTLSFALKDLASFDEARGAYVLEKGLYTLLLGTSSRDLVPAAALAAGEDILDAPLPHRLSYDLKEFSFPAAPVQGAEGLPVLAIPGETVFSPAAAPAPASPFLSEAEALVSSLSLPEKISLTVGEINRAQGAGGALGNAGSKVPGAAGETSAALEGQGICGLTMADGPAGLRLKKTYFVRKDGSIVGSGLLDALEGGIFAPEGMPEEGTTPRYQYCTAIPVGTALAQTWNEALVEEIGQMIRGEMKEMRVSLWLAPGMNIQRDPLCGRNFEYFSEDPLLTGRMAAAMVRGVQCRPGTGATIKHFACNNREENRKGVNSVLSERALREIYLKGFEIAVRESAPMAVMTSYNLVNNVHAANSRELCTSILREEWGFAGFVMTDWTTTDPNGGSISWKCLEAGNDLIMPGKALDVESIQRALEEGLLPMEQLEKCAARVLAAMLEVREAQKQDKEENA